MKAPETLSTLMPLIKQLVFDSLSPRHYYHHLEHTQQVITYALQLAAKANLNPREEEMLFAAAVLHDAGYAQQYTANEGLGANLASQILPDFGFSTREIEQVTQMILATNLGVLPNNLLEMLLIDADMAYLGQEDFLVWSNRLYKEWCVFGLFAENSEKWLISQIEFLQTHRYFTTQAVALFEAGKQKNIALLKTLQTWPF